MIVDLGFYALSMAEETNSRGNCGCQKDSRDSGNSEIDALLVEMESLVDWGGSLDNLLSSTVSAEVAIGGLDVSQVQSLTDIGINISDRVNMNMGENGWRYVETIGSRALFEGTGANADMVAAVAENSLAEDTQAAIAQIRQVIF
jgi:hypothetical protein